MERIPVKIKKLYTDVVEPFYATEGSAGFDIIAHNFKILYSSQYIASDLCNKRELLITPHSRILIGSGFAIEIPKGKELQIRPRSGLALKTGLTIINSPGTLDSDYRGELMVTLINTSAFAVEIKLGERIAQAVLADYWMCTFDIVEELSSTERGTGGMGSTGK